MTPSSRTQAPSGPWYPLVTVVNIESQILHSILSNSSTALVAKEDLSRLLTNSDDAQLSSFRSPFVSDEDEVDEDAFRSCLDALVSTPSNRQKAFVVLDQFTAGEKRTCQIAIDGRELEDIREPQFAFRCDVSSIPAALASIEDSPEVGPSTIRRMRNEAALVGGSWNKDRVDLFKTRPDRGLSASYPVHRSFDLASGCIGPETDIPYFGIFQTAQISLARINEFLQQTYDQDWGVEDDEDDEEAEGGERVRPAVAFITSFDTPPFHSGKAGDQLSNAPQVPPGSNGLSAIDCNTIAKSRFAKRGSEINYNMFIVLDEYSQSEDTVVIAANNEQDGQLLLGRASFNAALLTLVSPSDTSLTIDSQCNNAAVEGNGVICME